MSFLLYAGLHRPVLTSVLRKGADIISLCFKSLFIVLLSLITSLFHLQLIIMLLVITPEILYLSYSVLLCMGNHVA